MLPELARKEPLGCSLLAKGLVIHKTKLYKTQLKELWAFPAKSMGFPGVSVIPSKDQQLPAAAPWVSRALGHARTIWNELVC